MSTPTMRLGIFVTHPIQYFAPMWRGLSNTSGLEVCVYFFSDHSIRGGMDKEFGHSVAWDVPILEGYKHEFLTRDADLERASTFRIPDIERVFNAGAFDAVMIHGYTHPFERQVIRAARKRGLRIIVRGEFTDLVPYVRRGRIHSAVRYLYLRWFYRYITGFCYIGEEARRHLLRMGVPANRMFFSPYSVDTSLFETQKRQFSRTETRRSLGIPDGDVVLLFSGKLIPRKAPLLILEALRQIGGLDRVWLMVLGDGDLRQQVESEGRRLLENRLLMMGFVNQSQIGKYYLAADIFVLSSRFETWGLVVNDAMQFGLPVVISSRVGCQRDLVEKGVTGMVFADGDAGDLARCLQEVIGQDEKRARMGEAALRRIEGYSTKVSVDGIVQAIRSE